MQDKPSLTFRTFGSSLEMLVISGAVGKQDAVSIGKCKLKASTLICV